MLAQIAQWFKVDPMVEPEKAKDENPQSS